MEGTAFVRIALVTVLAFASAFLMGNSLDKYCKGRIATEVREIDQKSFLFPSFSICGSVQNLSGLEVDQTMITFALQHVVVNDSYSGVVDVHYDSGTGLGAGNVGETDHSIWSIFRFNSEEGETIQCNYFQPLRKTQYGRSKSLLFGVQTKQLLSDKRFLLLWMNDNDSMNWVGEELFGNNLKILPAHALKEGDEYVKMVEISLQLGRRKKISTQEKPCLGENGQPGNFGMCIDDYIRGKVGCAIGDVSCWEEKGQEKMAVLTAKLLEKLKTYSEREIIGETGCVPPCDVNDSSVTLESTLEGAITPRIGNGTTDMVIEIFNSRALLTRRDDYLVYDSYACFSDIGGQVGILLGLSFVAIVDKVVRGFAMVAKEASSSSKVSR